VQNTSNKYFGLDHLRALAITMVFLYHYHARIFGHPQWLPDIAKFGWTGVDLFFVLSGFLISSALFKEWNRTGSISVKDFFIKRVFRILPAFWVIVAIYFFVPAFHEREALRPLWRYLTFTQNFGLDVANEGTFSHAWSLCVEEHFYLFLPFILLALSALKIFRKGYWLLILLFITTICLRYYAFTNIDSEAEHAGVYWYMYIYYPSYCRLDGLLVGVVIAALNVMRPAAWEKISRYGYLWLVAGLLVLTGAYFLCYDEHAYYASVYGFSVVAIGYGLLVMGALSSNTFLYKRSSRITTFIASISYGIYLCHKGVIHVTQTILAANGMDINSNATMVISILASIIAAVILYFVVERPFMKWRRKFVA
jgi:peptidoglycan/LPS O-acetylase OafA/YrhL